MPLVLVIDDEESIRRLYRAEFEAAGFEVLERGDATGLAEAIASSLPDLLVLDIKMPGPGGLEVLMDLRPRYPKLPIILCSAFSSFQGDTRTLPADAYVLKSSDLNPLLETAQRLLAERA